MTSDRKPPSKIRALQQRFLRWLRGGDGSRIAKKPTELHLAVLDPRINYSASIMPVEFFADAAPAPTAQVDPDLLQMMSDWTAAENSAVLPPPGVSSTNPTENSVSTSGSGTISATSTSTTESNSEATADCSSGIELEPIREVALIDVQLNQLDQLLADMDATDSSAVHGDTESNDDADQLDQSRTSLSPLGCFSREPTESQELIIIQDGIDNIDQLIADLVDCPDDRFFDIFVLNGMEDGFAQLDRLLSQYEDLDAIHIISHGTEGTIQLGGSWLTAWNVEQH